MNPRVFLLALCVGCAGAVRAQVDVLTANYDNNRTNANLNEGILNTGNVNPSQFGKLYAYPVDGQVYAQPLCVHSLNMPGHGMLNVLYVATMHDSVYAFDADTAGGTPLWQVNLGSPVDPASLSVPGESYNDILHEIGILSTPVIDRTANAIYVVNETLSGGSMAFFLHALDLSTGNEKLNGPVQIQATVAGSGWGGTGDAVADGRLSLRAADHIQRPGLLLANGSIYAGFGSHGDYPPWHGWIVAYNAADLQQQTAVFNTTPSTAGSAIWQGGRGLAADPDGAVYCATGNGNYDGVMSWGETVLRLTPALNIADWFTPAEYASWTDEDLDFGSNGPILVPGTNLLIAGGKAGLVALVDRTDMGQHALDTDALQVFLAVPDSQLAIFNSALWNRSDGPILYVWGLNDALRAYQMQHGIFNPSLVAANSSAHNGLPGGMAVSSNAFAAGSGIFWATTTAGPDLPAAGTLHAFDAMDVSRELWNSDMQRSRDALGNFTKFANPTVANGKVYVPTDSNQLAVYGLLPAPGIASVVSAASFGGSTVAPGELIAIFGHSIGPPTPVSLALDSSGKVATSLGGVTVSFDGALAPLLYASAGQINAVVPFGVAGKSTTSMQLSAPGGAAFTATLPVSTAAPAMFVIGASGQGAILNGDLSVNSPANPAARGSWIAIYATGSGLLSPALADGAIVSATNLPLSVAPISVTIGGQTATIGYQGGAPGLVAGVMQINAQVPAGVAPGPAVPVTLSVGGTSGQNTVTLAVN